MVMSDRCRCTAHPILPEMHVHANYSENRLGYKEMAIGISRELPHALTTLLSQHNLSCQKAPHCPIQDGGVVDISGDVQYVVPLTNS